MTGRSHLVTGWTAAAWTVVAAHRLGVPQDWAAIAALFVMLGSVAPDIDARRSIATYSLGPVTMAISWVVRRYTVHRGATHDLVKAPVAFAAVTAAVTLAVPVLTPWAWLWALATAVGVYVHLWGDARTVGGIRLPSGERVTLGAPFKVGSKFEDWARRRIYYPVAVASTAAGLVLIGLPR